MQGVVSEVTGKKRIVVGWKLTAFDRIKAASGPQKAN